MVKHIIVRTCDACLLELKSHHTLHQQGFNGRSYDLCDACNKKFLHLHNELTDMLKNAPPVHESGFNPDIFKGTIPGGLLGPAIPFIPNPTPDPFQITWTADADNRTVGVSPVNQGTKPQHF